MGLKNRKRNNQMTEKILLKSEILLENLLEFYSNETNRNIFISIINQETSISLRLLDWLSTNYSKKFNVMYKLTEEETVVSSKNFNLWLDYKNQLKSFSKKLFDPFCRRQRILYDTQESQIRAINNNDSELFGKDPRYIITTPGQLNFFRWAIENKVVDYAFDHLDKIETDMLSSAEQRIANKKKTGSNKKSLSKNNHSAKGHELKILIQFS